MKTLSQQASSDNRKFQRIAKVFFFIALLMPLYINAQEYIYVNVNAKGLNNGTNWTNAYTSLQDAMDAAKYGTTLFIARGVYKPTKQYGGVGPRYAAFKVKLGIAIRGGFVPGSNAEPVEYGLGEKNETVLSGDIGVEGDASDNCYHVFYHAAGMNLDNWTYIESLTIRDGNSNYNPSSSAHEFRGGGVYNGNGNACEFQTCTFVNNKAGYGGGIYSVGAGEVYFWRCKFINNTAFTLGSGSNIEGGYGGAMYFDSKGAAELHQSLIVNNTAQATGGGIYLYSAASSEDTKAVIYNTTIVNNTAKLCGGVRLYKYSNCRMYNSIIWGNTHTSTDIGEQIDVTSSSTASMSNCCFSDDANDVTDNVTNFECISTNPQFSDPAVGDYRICGNSPCVDKPHTSSNGHTIPPYYKLRDLRDTQRPQNLIYDIGAYEYTVDIDPIDTRVARCEFKKCSVSSTAATITATVSTLGGSTPTQHGYCWKTFYYNQPAPTLNDSKIEFGVNSSVGDFTRTIEGLTAGTYYRFRPYITNSYGTFYGEEFPVYTPIYSNTSGLKPFIIGCSETIVNLPQNLKIGISYLGNLIEGKKDTAFITAPDGFELSLDGISNYCKQVKIELVYNNNIVLPIRLKSTVRNPISGDVTVSVKGGASIVDFTIPVVAEEFKVFNLKGRGNHCIRSMDQIYLDGTQPSVTYSLYCNGQLSKTLPGTGNSLILREGSGTEGETHLYTATATYNGCTKDMAGEWIITPTPEIAPIVGPAFVGYNDKVIFTCPTPGGKWSADGPATINAETGELLTKDSRGVVTIYYTLSTGCITSVFFKTEIKSVVVTSTEGTPIAGYDIPRSAYSAINAGTHKGKIYVGLSLSMLDYGNVNFVSKSGVGAASYDSLIIYPKCPNIVITSGTKYILNGNEHVLIDGRVNRTGSGEGRLEFQSSSLENLFSFEDGASHNTIQYCKFTFTGLNMLSSSPGFISFGSSSKLTGNSYNSINNNIFTGRLNNVITSVGNATNENTNNTISNNEFCDFLHKYRSSTAILVGNYNTNWNIIGNSFYDTDIDSGTHGINNSNEISIITINSPTGVFNISENYFGGSQPVCKGSMFNINKTTNGSIYLVSLPFIGINIKAVSPSQITKIQRNCFDKINFLTGANASFTAVNVESGKVDIGTSVGDLQQKGNFIGSRVGLACINYSATTSGGMVYGIRINSNDDVTVRDNVIGAFKVTNESNVNASGFTGILKTASAGNTRISQNIIGSTTYSTNIDVSSNASSNIQNVIGICNLSTGSVTISNNTIGYLNNATTNALAESSVIGLLNNSSSQTTISANFISRLYAPNSTLASIYGIKTLAGSTTLFNNVVALNDNVNNPLYGIYDAGTAGSNTNIYFNTVYLSGNSPANSPLKSYCLHSALNVNARDIENNIFSNVRATSGGNNLHYAVSIAKGGSLICNYNDYFVSGQGSKLGFYGTDKTALPIVNDAVGNDTKSQSVDPVFNSILAINSSGFVPSAKTLVGCVINGITTDIRGTFRGSSFNAMGAFEYPVTPPLTTGLQQSESRLITIYPNPVTDAFCVAGLKGASFASLFDVSGKLIQVMKIYNQQWVNVNALTRGFYMLRINDENGFEDVKIIKE